MSEKVFFKNRDGTLTECHDVEIVYRPQTSAEGDLAVERAHKYLAETPFYELAGKPPEHKIVGELEDGFKVRAIHAETVYNDWLFMDYCYGAGHYELHARNREREILTLARQLFSAGTA